MHYCALILWKTRRNSSDMDMPFPPLVFDYCIHTSRSESLSAASALRRYGVDTSAGGWISDCESPRGISAFPAISARRFERQTASGCCHCWRSGDAGTTPIRQERGCRRLRTSTRLIMAPILLPGPRRKPYRELKYKSSDSLVYLRLRDDGTGLSAHHGGGKQFAPNAEMPTDREGGGSTRCVPALAPRLIKGGAQPSTADRYVRHDDKTAMTTTIVAIRMPIPVYRRPVAEAGSISRSISEPKLCAGSPFVRVGASCRNRTT